MNIALPTEMTMQGAFARLVGDFFSTILFLVLYLATGSIVLATTVAIAGAIGQLIYARLTGKELSFMT
jgi:intracellular septation protein